MVADRQILGRVKHGCVSVLVDDFCQPVFDAVQLDLLVQQLDLLLVFDHPQ